VIRFPPRRSAPGRRQPLQGAADGLEPGHPGAPAPALARHSRTPATSISFTAFTRARPMSATVRGNRLRRPLYLGAGRR
jgi:hypothetical protein